jgi:hypothetical protein
VISNAKYQMPWLEDMMPNLYIQGHLAKRKVIQNKKTKRAFKEKGPNLASRVGLRVKENAPKTKPL